MQNILLKASRGKMWVVEVHKVDSVEGGRNMQLMAQIAKHLLFNSDKTTFSNVLVDVFI